MYHILESRKLTESLNSLPTVRELCFGGGWFIVMAYLPTGQVSNHYRIEDWNLFNIPERWKADEWDGHTPVEAANRLYRFCYTIMNIILYGNVSRTIN